MDQIAVSYDDTLNAQTRNVMAIPSRIQLAWHRRAQSNACDLALRYLPPVDKFASTDHDRLRKEMYMVCAHHRVLDTNSRQSAN